MDSGAEQEEGGPWDLAELGSAPASSYYLGVLSILELSLV